MYLPQFPVTSGYGPRGAEFHYGVDFGTPIGTSFPCIATGTVKFAAWTAGLNQTRELIIVVQSDGFYIAYGHLSQALCKTGDHVTQGQIIGKTGNSGYTSGPHLHVQEHTGTFTSGIFNNPVKDITSRLKAYGGSMNTNGLDEFTTRRIVEGAYQESTNEVPSKAIIDQKVAFILEHGSSNVVLGDIFSLNINYCKKSNVPGDQQKEIDEALIHLDTAEKILREA